MKLRVGGKYKNRSGDVVEILSSIKSTDYPFIGSNKESYTNDGHFRLTQLESILDLIEELPDEQVKPKRAKFVQILDFAGEKLLALDECGEVWFFIEQKNVWKKSHAEREE